MAFEDVSGRSWPEVTSLKDRVIVVTGPAHGIGQAIARRAAEAGASLVLADTDAGPLGVLSEELRSNGRACEPHPFDARDPAAHTSLANAAVDRFGRIDGWVNDAGEYPIKPALEITPEDWNEVIALNLTGYFFGAQAAARAMGERGGVIVNIASSLGYHGVPNQASYVSSKFAVRGLTAALAVEWSERGVRVVAVGPGMIDTQSMRKAAAQMPVAADPFETYAKTSLAKRAGVPDDIARAVVFLLSDASAYVTGSTWLVDGGEVASGGMA